MKYSKDYVAKIIESVEKRNPGEPEFIQAVKEVVEYLRSFSPIWRDLISGKKEFVIK